VSLSPIHAGCVAIGGRGVLIAGASGAGKSDLAMRLIDRGAELVADDYVELRRDGEALIAAPPAAIAGRIELRGIGILTLPFRSEVPVALLVDLDVEADRLPEAKTRELCGVALPTLGLNALEPSAPIKVEAALLLHGLPISCPR
jgi:serine kinase of HPr protein (carbohydrate metabolism regulator)